MTVSLRELDGARATFRDVLDKHEPCMVVVADQAGRCVEVDLFPDGADAWTLSITSAGRVLFDCEGNGVRGLTDEMIAFAVIASFRVLDTPAPQAN